MNWGDLNPLKYFGPPKAPSTIMVPDPNGGTNPDGSPVMVAAHPQGTMSTVKEVGQDLRDVAKNATGQPTSGDIANAYKDKAKGYDAIRAEVDRLKAERMNQKQYAYDLANEKMQPSRDALAAVYGDPRTWKL